MTTGLAADNKSIVITVGSGSACVVSEDATAGAGAGADAGAGAGVEAERGVVVVVVGVGLLVLTENSIMDRAEAVVPSAGAAKRRICTSTCNHGKQVERSLKQDEMDIGVSAGTGLTAESLADCKGPSPIRSLTPVADALCLIKKRNRSIN